MMKYALIFAAFTALTVPSSLAQTPDNVPEIDFGPTEPLTIVAENGPITFDVEIADTDEEQSRGLMYRETLGANKGMLFEFAEPKVATIWMKNTPLPLDIIFVRENGKILKIEHSAVPYSLRSASSEAVVAAVLELEGGQAYELGIRPGDLIQHEFFGTLPKNNAEQPN